MQAKRGIARRRPSHNSRQLFQTTKSGDSGRTITIHWKQPGLRKRHVQQKTKKSNKLLKHHGKPKAKKSTTKNLNKGSSIKTAKEAKPMIASITIKDHKLIQQLQ